MGIRRPWTHIRSRRSLPWRRNRPCASSQAIHHQRRRPQPTMARTCLVQPTILRTKKWCYRYENHPNAIILIRADLSTKGPFAAFTASDAIWIPRGRLQFVNGRGGKTGAVNFSTIMLGRGQQAAEAMQRLASFNGTTRLLK